MFTAHEKNWNFVSVQRKRLILHSKISLDFVLHCLNVFFFPDVPVIDLNETCSTVLAARPENFAEWGPPHSTLFFL